MSFLSPSLQVLQRHQLRLRVLHMFRLTWKWMYGALECIFPLRIQSNAIDFRSSPQLHGRPVHVLFWMWKTNVGLCARGHSQHNYWVATASIFRSRRTVAGPSPRQPHRNPLREVASLIRSLLTYQTICSFLLLVGDRVFGVRSGLGSDSVQKHTTLSQKEIDRKNAVGHENKIAPYDIRWKNVSRVGFGGNLEYWTYCPVSHKHLE